jgi:hypothetical protein
MDKKPYTVLADTPRLGKAGATVSMTAREARYLLRAGVLAADAPAPKKAEAKPKAAKKDEAA